MICLHVLGRVQTAGKSDSNLIPSHIRFLGLTVHTVFSKCPNRIWLCSDWATLLTDLTGCCSNDVGAEATPYVTGDASRTRRLLSLQHGDLPGAAAALPR